MTEEKQRHWFIEINASAECFDTIKTKVESIEKAKYGLIYHDKDIDADNKPKTPHYHLMISYENARTFTAIQKHFKGAHIEQAVNVAKCVQYLLHLNDKDKHQYEPTEIITNNADWIKANLDKKAYPVLNQEEVIREVKQLRLRGFNYGYVVYFYIKYGNEQVKPYRQMILDLEKCGETIETMEDIVNEQLPF